jgi:hypothetical protein
MLYSRRFISSGPRQCRLKHLFEFAQGLGPRESWLGDSSLAAGRDVQHPERYFQNPRCLEVFQAAVRHRSAAFYESGMYPYCPPMPWMPRIANFTEIPNMGVMLPSCTTTSAYTRVSLTGRQRRFGSEHERRQPHTPAPERPLPFAFRRHSMEGRAGVKGLLRRAQTARP